MQEDEIETLRRAMWALELGVAAVTDSGVRDVLRERAKELRVLVEARDGGTEKARRLLTALLAGPVPPTPETRQLFHEVRNDWHHLPDTGDAYVPRSPVTAEGMVPLCWSRWIGSTPWGMKE